MASFVNVMDLVYPVGSIYQSMSPTSPASIFLGTWTQIKEGFLRSALDSGVTGGSLTQTLKAENLPPHKHTTYGGWQDSSGSDFSQDIFIYSKWTIKGYMWKLDCAGQCDDAKSTAFSILPPYTTCYTWYRTS